MHGSQAPTTVTVPQSSGKALPPHGNAATSTAAANAKSSASNRSNDLQAQVAFLNKYLNESGKPDQFRVAPNSNSMLIQEINPANGAVLGQYPAIAFPALARSLGVSSALIDEYA
ncbi:MAG TPA: hypothetical protein VME42_15600 [Steroidobacteraceae bacterium]|nr:hypothetical protein [Steroidobacteraceae bacterium]